MTDKFDKDEQDFETAPTFKLYDEAAGTEADYVLLARTVLKGKLLYALTALSDPESYVILSVKEDGEDIIFESITDDELFEEAVGVFDELLSEEMDYDSD